MVSLRVAVVTAKHLYSFLASTLFFQPFQLYVHILTEPYISLLSRLPPPVRDLSEIYLDGEKSAVNDYAVNRLSQLYRIWYVKRLHTKLVLIGSKAPPEYIVLGSSNLSERSFTNHEAILVIKNPTQTLYERLKKAVIDPVRRSRYLPKVK